MVAADRPDDSVVVTLIFGGSVDFGGGIRRTTRVKAPGAVALDRDGAYLWDRALPAASVVPAAT